MVKVSQTSKIMIKTILLLAPIEIAVGLLILSNSSFYVGHIAGIIIGSVVSVIKLVWLEGTIEKVIDMDKDGGTRYFKLQSFFRNMVSLAVFAAAAFLHPKVNIISTAVGIANMTIAAYLFKFIGKRFVEGEEPQRNDDSCDSN